MNLRARRIGYVCHFVHPETGEVIQGVYRKGRRVERMTKMTRLTNGQRFGRGFDIETQTFRVPRNVKITMGAKP